MKPTKPRARGQAISINGSGGQTLMNEWKRKLSSAAVGVPVRAFTPLKISREMQIALDRCKELTALPSRF